MLTLFLLLLFWRLQSAETANLIISFKQQNEGIREDSTAFTEEGLVDSLIYVIEEVSKVSTIESVDIYYCGNIYSSPAFIFWTNATIFTKYNIKLVFGNEHLLPTAFCGLQALSTNPSFEYPSEDLYVHYVIDKPIIYQKELIEVLPGENEIVCSLSDNTNICDSDFIIARAATMLRLRRHYFRNSHRNSQKVETIPYSPNETHLRKFLESIMALDLRMLRVKETSELKRSFLSLAIKSRHLRNLAAVDKKRAAVQAAYYPPSFVIPVTEKYVEESKCSMSYHTLIHSYTDMLVYTSQSLRRSCFRVRRWYGMDPWACSNSRPSPREPSAWHTHWQR